MNKQINMGDVIRETVSVTAILCHEFYTHPESSKDIPSPDFMVTCHSLFNRYLSKQIVLIKTFDDIKAHAKTFIQMVVDEDKKALEEIRAKKEESENDITKD